MEIIKEVLIRKDEMTAEDAEELLREVMQEFNYKISQGEYKDKAEFKNFALSCPWHENELCMAIDVTCSKNHCGVLYWIENNYLE